MQGLPQGWLNSGEEYNDKAHRQGESMSDYNKGNYFVMLTCQNGGIAPMMCCEEIATYDSVDEAIESAMNNPLGINFGFEVFEVGMGEHQS